MNPLTSMAGNSQIGSILAIMKMMHGKDPNAVAQMLAQKNPQFKRFMESCNGKTPDQVAKEYGIDLSAIRQFIR